MNVFYRPEQVATNSKSWGSPSSAKPALVVSDWLQRGLIGPGQLHSFEPVELDDLKRVHCADYVDDVMALQINNGFENRDADVARSLPYTCGSLLAACQPCPRHK